jgi:hypothetical protein
MHDCTSISPARQPTAPSTLKKRSKRQSCQLANSSSENEGFSSKVPRLLNREDWTLFRNISTLGQKAGVTQETISKLVAKELGDNGLDATGACVCGILPSGRVFFQDEGPGLPGTDDEIGSLFSVARPLASSKLLRLPTRGALGNGLRVVAGAVLASNGELVVKTRGRALRLRPRDIDGGTDVEHLGPWIGRGTRVEVRLGASLLFDEDTLGWARGAIAVAEVDGQTYYRGNTSAWWYDSDSFYELTQAADRWTVRELVAQFAGCSGVKAGKLTTGLTGRLCKSLTRQEAESLLAAMRTVSRQVTPKRLGAVGPRFQPDAGYAREVGTFTTTAARGDLSGVIPHVVEAWASPADLAKITFHVNRTPITGEIAISRCMKDKSQYGLMGCGLSNEHRNTAFPIKVGKGREFLIVVNVIAPYMPITTDGKAPNLAVIGGALQAAIKKAVRRAKRKNGNGGKKTYQNAAIVEALPAAIAKVSGEGTSRYGQRQLFYEVRARVENAMGIQIEWGYFCDVITDHENDRGTDLPGMYRDDRGTLYHPHTGETIPLGTRSVEAYSRPKWTFNKILYREKEGFFPILIDTQWPEQHDCALLTSKGYSSRAVRDVVDLLGDTDEPLTFYCIHDADGPGTMIYQTLQDGTKARPARRVKIVNLGLEPEEAMLMRLPAEPVELKKKAVPVADYVDDEWRQWLQTHRIELNAMDTPMFLEWLDGKMEQYAGKLIPPLPILTERLVADTRGLIRQRLVAEAIRAARVDEETEAAIAWLQPQITRVEKQLLPTVRKDLAASPAAHWSGPIGKAAETLAAKIARDSETG